MSDEKKDLQVNQPRRSSDAVVGDVEEIVLDSRDDFEVFKKGGAAVDFRLVSWPRASVIFLKGTCYPPKLLRFMLTVSCSHLCDGCVEYTWCHVWTWSCWRIFFGDWLGRFEYL